MVTLTCKLSAGPLHVSAWAFALLLLFCCCPFCHCLVRVHTHELCAMRCTACCMPNLCALFSSTDCSCCPCFSPPLVAVFAALVLLLLLPSAGRWATPSAMIPAFPLQIKGASMSILPPVWHSLTCRLRTAEDEGGEVCWVGTRCDDRTHTFFFFSRFHAAAPRGPSLCACYLTTTTAAVRSRVSVRLVLYMCLLGSG